MKTRRDMDVDQLIRAAEPLVHGRATGTFGVTRFVVQMWSVLNEQWMDSAVGLATTEAEAWELFDLHTPSARWPRHRVVRRTVTIREEEVQRG